MPDTAAILDLDDAATHVSLDAESGVLQIAGELGVHQLTRTRQKFAQLKEQGVALAEVDLRALEKLDTAGALLITRWLNNIPIAYRDDAQRALLEQIVELDTEMPPVKQPSNDIRHQVIALGRWGSEVKKEGVAIATFTGKALVMLKRNLAHRHQFRIGAISQYIYQIGVTALPIIGLMAFLISVVLAYQGVAQLRPYGGEQFTVNLVALSILREMGVLLTAIMVAGRSGSAFTAEIGVMKSREEVDALQVMGLDPFAMLVTPRLIAILIALPLLTFYADMLGLIGGYFVTNTLIEIPLGQYIERVHQAADGSDLFVGIIKAPVFALCIGIVGCMHGLRVSGSAESIGRETTSAVVKSIFLVLGLDALFSVFFEQVGL